jgi:hypothetical protein
MKAVDWQVSLADANNGKVIAVSNNRVFMCFVLLAGQVSRRKLKVKE